MALPLPGGPDPDPGRQQKFEALARAMPGFGGKDVEIRYGSGTWTWPGGQSSSGITTVTHGLGRIPVGVWVMSNQDQGANEVIVADAFTYTATTFGTRGSSKVGTNYAAASTATFVWFAIG